MIQNLEPPGIASRNLQECLSIQLKRKPKTDETLIASKIIEEGFHLFSKKHFKKMQEKFSLIYKQQPSIFKMCLDGSMDIERLTFMINMVKKVKSNNISEHDASVEVGQRLVDEFVKPKIEEK